jgi:hypothetical protein
MFTCLPLYYGTISYSPLTLLSLGRKIIIVSDVPTLHEDPNRLLWISKRFNVEFDFKKLSPTISEYQKLNESTLKIFNDLEKNQNVKLVYPDFLLFDKSGKAMVMVNKKSLYIDKEHLSTYGSHYIAPVFDDVFKEMVVRK